MLINQFSGKIISLREFSSNLNKENFLNVEILHNTWRWVNGAKLEYQTLLRFVCPASLKNKMDLGNEVEYIFTSKVSARQNFLKIFVNDLEIVKSSKSKK